MRQLTFIKQANSKGKLAKAVISYQQALLYYAKEENWALKTNELSHQVGKLITDMGEEFRLSHPELLDAYHASLDGEIVWIGDDDPTYVANLVLGKVKPKQQPKPEPVVREPDKIPIESNISDPPNDNEVA